ncbi:MAG: thioredoxin fold domain-containing protein [Planctomycetes bacterium]|nr:thioredoxin fold domain-containing protein [Planctomycetota bacterium]
MNKVSKICLIAVLVAAVGALLALSFDKSNAADPPETAAADAGKKLPLLLDLGSKKCIPCKLMAPILEELDNEYAGKFDVTFIDVWQKENAQAARKHGIKLIPTQIFFDANGKELWRHEGFLSKKAILGKWKELGYNFQQSAVPAKIERWAPAKPDNRAKSDICYMCDGDINAKTAVVVRTDKGDVRLCGPHCYFIMYSCLTEDKAGFEEKVSVTGWSNGKLVPAPDAAYLHGLSEQTGRPWVKAFESQEAAKTERTISGGSIVTLPVLQQDELSHRCGFCDRAVYPQDAAKVIAGGIHSYGCCSHCALGVAVRSGLDIEVRERDRLTGEPVIVKTLDGGVGSIEPDTAVAWHGMRQKPDATWGSAGCFHQGFFASAETLKKWLERNPLETGKQITIQQALADKMKLTPQQVQKACKIGECSPK